MEALLSATRHGGAIMGRGDELGQVRDGYLADLLLVDGDPLANLGLLREPARLLAVMKDGVFYKEPEFRASRTRWTQSVA
jgi:imidazolonepropionase-like amidohydrolase